MRPALTVASILLGLGLLYLVTWPVPVEPVAWQAPENPGMTGAFTPNDQLARARPIDISPYTGAENAVIGTDRHIYATVREGYVLRISPSGQRVEVYAETGGAPLGIALGPDGALYVANAYTGLQRIPAQGEVETLTDTIAGRPLRYANDLAVARDGRIFFTESSSKFGARAYGGTLDASVIEILEHGGNGVLAVFDPDTGNVRVLLDGLTFANGVALSVDERYLLVAETGHYRVHRYWLDGPTAGGTEVIVDNLPGFPDNVDTGMNGRYWIGLVSPRNALVDRLAGYPRLRKVVYRLPRFIRPSPARSSHLIAIDGHGVVLMSPYDPAATYPMVTGAIETPKSLYITTLTGSALPLLSKDTLH